MSTQTQNENEIDISPMLKDINAVLKGHLTSLLGPIINEKNAIHNVLLNMPYVKRLKAENEVLGVRVIQLNTELEALKKYYEKELENASKKNVKLEVRDSISSSNETPSKIVELKNQMWRKNEKVNSQEEDDDDDDDNGGLYGEEDDDDDDEDEDQEYENPIITNLKMSLNKSESVVEITSNGTIETSEEETDNTIKNVTVWDLNKKEENPENNEEEEEEEEDEEEDDEEDDEEDHEEEEVDEEEEEEDDDEEEDDEEEEEDDEEDDEEGLDVEDVEIDGVLYLTTSTENGEIYKCDEDGEIVEDENGDFVICGYFKNGIANFI